jgi:hypothetical protein
MATAATTRMATVATAPAIAATPMAQQGMVVEETATAITGMGTVAITRTAMETGTVATTQTVTAVVVRGIAVTPTARQEMVVEETTTEITGMEMETAGNVLPAVFYLRI